jgi:hypothetical protein
MFSHPWRAGFAAALCGLSLLAATLPAAAFDGNSSGQFRAQLTGLPQVPSVLTRGHGSFTAELVDGDTALRYELSYADLSGPASMAHIHVGRTGKNGGVIITLCGGPGQACPRSAGTVRGTITAADVQAIAAQGVASGDFQGLLTLLRNGATYVNVHTPMFAEGEIRGQVSASGADSDRSEPKPDGVNE